MRGNSWCRRWRKGQENVILPLPGLGHIWSLNKFPEWTEFKTTICVFKLLKSSIKSIKRKDRISPDQTAEKFYQAYLGTDPFYKQLNCLYVVILRYFLCIKVLKVSKKYRFWWQHCHLLVVRRKKIVKYCSGQEWFKKNIYLNAAIKLGFALKYDNMSEVSLPTNTIFVVFSCATGMIT